MASVPVSDIRVDVESLGNCLVQDDSKNPVALKTLWAEAPAALVFLRHFACIACRAHAVDTWKHRQLIESGGTKIYFIGNGSPDFISRFKKDLNMTDAQVFTDPSLVSFRLAGFKRGFLVSHGPASMASGIKLHLRGHRQQIPGGGSGDLWQLGGTLMIRPDGVVSYHYISEALGDLSPSRDLEAAVAMESAQASKP